MARFKFLNIIYIIDIVLNHLGHASNLYHNADFSFISKHGLHAELWHSLEKDKRAY